MYLHKKNTIILSLLWTLFSTTQLTASDTVTITTPANSSTVSGEPLSITGTSSRANFRVRLTINTTEIGSDTTDGSGNWNFDLQDLNDGNYTITADLMSSSFEILATDTNSFTVQNPAVIIIDLPESAETIMLNPSMATGTASLASAPVQLFIDDILVAVTSTDSEGYWQAPYTVTSNGSHTLLAKLLSSTTEVASTDVDFTAAVPVIFPSGTAQLRLINGTIPTSGSGSGNGFTYNISGSTATITFAPAFSSVPIILATGGRAAGASTLTIASVSTSATNIAFSTDTETIHFVALQTL